MDREYLTPEEAADLLQVNAQTVYRNLRVGKLPGAKVGAHWRIPRTALDEFMRTGTWWGQGHGMTEGRWRVQEDYGLNDMSNQTRWGWIVRLANTRADLNPVIRERAGSWNPDSGIRREAMAAALVPAVINHLDMLLLEVHTVRRRIEVLEKEGRNPQMKAQDQERLAGANADQLVTEVLAWLNKQGQGYGGRTTYKVVHDEYGLPKVAANHTDYRD